MQRIAYIAHVKPGKETECREVQAHMPVGALKRLGINSLEAFIGSGYYVTLFECEEQDFQGLFQRYFSDRGIRGFLDKLRPFVEGFPGPEESFAPGDMQHRSDQPPAERVTGAVVTSGQLPFAASAYRWSAQVSQEDD
jgi:hypothetical protein